MRSEDAKGERFPRKATFVSSATLREGKGASHPTLLIEKGREGEELPLQ